MQGVLGAFAEIKEILPPKMKHPHDVTHDLDALTIDPGQTMGDD